MSYDLKVLAEVAADMTANQEDEPNAVRRILEFTVMLI